MNGINLIYFCYIRDIDNVDLSTKYGILSLKYYKDVFNGQKIIFISGENLTDYFKEKSVKLFNFLKEIDIYFVQNNSNNRESEHFIESIKKIKNEDSITFYAHNKGSTHSMSYSLKIWIASMFYFNLSKNYLKEVKNNLILGEYVFSGIYKKIYSFFGSDWHYSGAFFWFNTKRLLEKKNWENIDKSRMGLESYPGNICSISESYSSLITINGDFHMDENLSCLIKSNTDEDEFKQFENYTYKIENKLN